MDQLDFQGRVAVVTGAGRGIGREYAASLASRGARVVVNDVGRAGADEAVDAITSSGGQAVADYGDVVTGADGIIQTALTAFDRLDIVINNAGIVRFGLFGEQDPADWWQAFDVHVRGTVEVTRAAWQHLVRSGSGRVINIASSAMLAEPGISSYTAAKAAIWGLSNTLAAEGAAVGVQVVTIMPSAWTPALEESVWDPDIERTFRANFTPEKVAAFVTWIAHQDTTVTHTTFQVCGGHAGRMVFAARPTVQVTDQTPEAWTALEGALLKGEGELTVFHDEGEMVASQLAKADPALAKKLAQGSPTAGAQQRAEVA